MKIRTCVLSVAAGAFFLSAGTDRAGLTEGCRPGNLASGIKLPGTDAEITFPDSSARYTLLHFWAAYDAESRMRNVQLWNVLRREGRSQVKMVSVSVDRLTSVFAGTVKADRLEGTNQVHEALGEDSEVYKKYGLKKGLRNFLIDGNGVIIATDVTPDRLSGMTGKREM
ncbi:MAG: thioredoxin family protein [Tannerella sp.]|nr:thioredoxin family protein [Tannerella sp.]